MKIPLFVTPEDLTTIPDITQASRMTVWDKETKQETPTRSMKIVWEGSTMPDIINLGFMGQFPVRQYIREPVRCYQCQQWGHTSRTCNKDTPVCGLCSGSHRTRVCVEKKTLQPIVKKCSNCKGDHCTASLRCPVRKALVQKTIPQKTTYQPAPAPLQSAWATKSHIPTPKTTSIPVSASFVPGPLDFPAIQQMRQAPKPKTVHPSRRNNQTQRTSKAMTPSQPTKTRTPSGGNIRTSTPRKQSVHTPTSTDKRPPKAPKVNLSQKLQHTRVPPQLQQTDTTMHLKDIISTSEVLVFLHRELTTKIQNIAPNKQLYRVLQSISQSMVEITEIYGSCIGTLKVPTTKGQP